MKRIPTLVYVEGLWGTGKSYFLNKLKETKKNKNLLVHDDLRKLNSMRHASYVMYPTIIDSKYQVFDRSPITLKAISDPSFKFYDGREVPSTYWNAYYKEWIKYLKESEFRIIFMYFRPFTQNIISLDVLNAVKNYDKDRLMVDPIKINMVELEKLHNLYIEIILESYKELKPKSDYYGIEFKDTESAIETLKYENIF